ncbi:MAG: ABC transporter permease subunit [Proteobacteria bacterium]|nr:ABC transporter permease subunit [Pseudomonadota bacterium]
MTAGTHEEHKPSYLSDGRGQRATPGAIVLFLAPVMIFFGIFIVYPVLQSFYNAFHRIEPVAGEMVTTFIGLENFRQLLDDDILRRAIKNTLIWGVFGTAFEMLTATTLAFVVYFKVPFHRFYRAAWFSPLLLSGVIVGLVFRWIFNFDWGLLNEGFRFIGLDSFALNWLGRADTPLYSVIFVHWWATFGFSFILLLAGLTAISEELVDAARVDGATTRQIAMKVLLPLLRPTFAAVLILAFMGKMRAFNVVWVLTNGGPLHMSETVATYVQKRAFGWSTLDLGYPSAIAVAWFGVVLVSVALINRWFQSRDKA